MRKYKDSCSSRRYIKDPWIFFFILLMASLLFLFVVFPLLNIFKMGLNYKGVISLRNYYELLLTPSLRQVFCNSLFMAGISMSGAMIVGFLFAYLITSTDAPGKKFFEFTAILPLVSPPFVVGMAFLMLFGRRGLLTYGLFGRIFEIYGWYGLFFVQTLCFFPLAYLFISSSLQSLDPDLRYAAQNLGGSGFYVFRTVDFPLLMPGILGAALLISATVLSDFGNPLLIGGRFSVLATEIYLEATTMMRIERAAALCLFLLIPSLTFFLIQQYYLSKKSFITVTGTVTASKPKPTKPWIKWPLFFFCLIISVIIMLLYGAIFVGTFTKVWGVDYSFSLENLKNAIGARGALKNSLVFALAAATCNSFLGIIIAYTLLRKKFFGRGFMDFISVVLFVIPGTIVGVGYVTRFNVPPLILTGTPLLIVLSMIFRNMPLGVRAGKAALRQISPSIEEASMNLGAGSFRTIQKIIFPLLKSPFFFTFIYTFIKSLTTLSTVIFLVFPGCSVASVTIVNMVETGMWGNAAALAFCLVAISVMLLILLRVILGKKTKLFQFQT